MVTRFFSAYGANPNAGAVETRGGAYLNAAHAFVRTFGNSSITSYRHMGMYLDDKGNARVLGAYSDGYNSYAYYYGLGEKWAINKDYKYYAGQVWGTFLVSDGGTTLSSINNPVLNINNPNAPVNQVPEAPADVPVHAGFGLLGLLLMAFGIRRRKSL